MPPVTRVATELDFEREGKHVSTFDIAQPTNESAFHALRIPAAVLKRGQGPTALLIGGVHGDEIEGPVALLKLLRRLRPEHISGRVIIVPALNLPAAQAGMRLSPLDGRDLNRSFPGEPSGSVTGVIAHFTDSVLLPLCDLVLDLHSGGRSLRFLDCLWFSKVTDRNVMQRSHAAARAFAAPIAIVSPELGAGAMSSSAERLGKVYLSSEVSGGAVVSPASLALVEAGIDRLLVHLGILDPVHAAGGGGPARFMHMPNSDHYPVAAESGLLEPLREIGEAVAAGAMIARIHRIEKPSAEPEPVVARCDGLLVGRRALGHVKAGDCIAAIAQDLPPA